MGGNAIVASKRRRMMPAALRVVIHAEVSKADSEGTPRTKATGTVKIDQVQLKLPIGSDAVASPQQ
jgi:hypothetical protein